MAGKTQRGKGGEESSEQQRTRLEMSWPVGSRELDDLARVAERIRGNPGRRGEASAYVIRLWSQVLHGEISTTSFWEMFGVTAQASAAPMVPPKPSPAPAIAPEAPRETWQAEDRQATRAKNRAAQADQWST